MKKLNVLLFVLMFIGIGCFSGYKDESKETTPLLIISFDEEPNTINQSETSTISWVVTGASLVSIDN
jgi:hypothetical protein